MNRTWIRGVTAGIGASMALAVAGIVGPQIAHGAESRVDWNQPIPLAEQQSAMHWTLPDAGRFLRRAHRAPRHVTHHASRSTYRSPLSGSPQTVAHALMLRAGWSESQWTCLDALWTRESSWNIYASNGGSGAYGIPQALPGSKMASYGADWRTNPVTQIRWGLWYIGATYGSPCNALAHSNAYGYY